MGYPMNYGRVIGRNKLDGDYDPAEHTGLGLIRGDLRRMEKDQQDDAHVAAYARRAGTTFAQAKQILADVFSDQDVLWQPAPNNPEVAAAPEARAQVEICHAPSSSGLWFTDGRRECYTCGAKCLSGERIICRFVPPTMNSGSKS